MPRPARRANTNTNSTSAHTRAKPHTNNRQQVERQEAKLEQQHIVTKDQLAVLQTRLEVLHASELLSDDELGAVEDCLADFFEASAGCEHMTMETASMNRAVGTALKLIALSEGMTKDTMFARQVKRKFC